MKTWTSALRCALWGWAIVLGVVVPAFAQVIVPGADGSDGALHVTANTTIDLSQAIAATWDTPSTAADQGKGVYDGSKWAVVFKYSSVIIDANRTLNFTNHPSHAPVVWLVSGDVTINGAINLSGAGSAISGSAVPGPGGFAGGYAQIPSVTSASAGFGPGGGAFVGSADSSNGGSYTYGNSRVLPLIGGSGGSGAYGAAFNCATYGGGGAGGGAILIAAHGTVTLSGAIAANGGGGMCLHNCINCGATTGGGSGGAIRLIANSISGAGTLRANGSNNGGAGRARVEANSTVLSDPGQPAYTFGLPGSTATIWPAAGAASVAFLAIDTANHSTQGPPAWRWDDPYGNTSPPTDVVINAANPAIISIETRNIATTAPVTVRVVPVSGQDATVGAVLESGDFSQAIWTARVNVPVRISTLIATAGAGSNIAVSRHYSVYGYECVADVDDGSGAGIPDDAVTIDDLLFFLARYSEGSVQADVDDGNGLGHVDGAVTIDDLLYMLRHYVAGC